MNHMQAIIEAKLQKRSDDICSELSYGRPAHGVGSAPLSALQPWAHDGCA